MSLKFFLCPKCKKIILPVQESACETFCCGDAMKEIVAGTTDAAREKHVPVVNVEGNVVNVSVGSVHHPMLEKHSIQWVALQSKEGFQIKYLKPGDTPTVSFALSEGDSLETVYAYCDLHSLWMA